MTFTPSDSTRPSVNDPATEKPGGFVTKRGSTVSLDENASVGHGNDIRAINAKLANPLAGISREQLIADGEDFARKNGLEDLSELFKKGALIAQDPLGFEDLPLLTDEEKRVLREEVTHKWKQPKMLYYLVILCSSEYATLMSKL